MSLTENDSGPFVIFFLPAVIGCLTILLARRWANSQVSSGSTTAVSRRRKIIKDPLIKRPLPPLTCKMLPTGTKKTNGYSKKGILTAEEEMHGNGKRYNRSPNYSMPGLHPHGIPDGKNDEPMMHPKHIPFPQIPQDSDLFFETVTFVFTVMSAGLQFLNLYRTMWYLPNSNMNQAMHFHLIDVHLVVFIGAILSRRLLYTLVKMAVDRVLEPEEAKMSYPGIRMLVLGVILGSAGWCTYFIAIKYPLLKLFYLCYPALIYFLLFGFQTAPFLELQNGEMPILHNCTPDTQQLRNEVDHMREDFNMKVKKILFNSVLGAYYTSFIPCCFAQAYLYYERERALQQVAFVWGALFCRLAAHLLSATACDAPHRAALHLAATAAAARHLETAAGAAEAWPNSRPLRRQSRSSATKHAPATAAAHLSFYGVFKNPSTLLCILLCLQMSLVLVQLCLLFTTSPWNNFVAIFLLLFINYYTMFKLVRDYLVSWKVYKAERMIQEKNDMAGMMT